MILVLLGGGCLRDLDHAHPEPVQVVVDALQKLQHLHLLFLPMFVCTSFLLANIFRALFCLESCLYALSTTFFRIYFSMHCFVGNCLCAPGFFEKSVFKRLYSCTNVHSNPQFPPMYSKIKGKNAFLVLYSSFIESLHVCVVTLPARKKHKGPVDMFIS